MKRRTVLCAPVLAFFPPGKEKWRSFRFYQSQRPHELGVRKTFGFRVGDGNKFALYLIGDPTHPAWARAEKRAMLDASMSAAKVAMFGKISMPPGTSDSAIVRLHRMKKQIAAEAWMAKPIRYTDDIETMEYR